MFGGHKHCGSGDNGFSLSRDFARPRDQKVIRLYRSVPIKVSCHPVKSGSYRQCSRGDFRFQFVV